MMDALTITGLRKNFGKMEIIKGVNLSVRRGERHAIIGPNGAGKSTFFHLISGLYQPSSGSIRLDGVEVGGMKPAQIFRKGLARSFQVTNLFPRMTVYENIRCGAMWAGGHGYAWWKSIDRQRDTNELADQIIERVGLSHRSDQPASVLSYAEQRALEIGVTIAADSPVIMLDEPTAGMSVSETEQAIRLIRTVSAEKTLVVVEHDMNVVFNLADRISVLVYGRIIATGTPEEIRQNPIVQEAYLGTEVTGHA